MNINKSYYIFFIIFAALVVTIWGYQFGMMDHLEFMPILARVKDPTYIANDFFLNATEKGFDPRYYFSLLVLLLNKALPLPYIYFLLTLFCNICIAWASFAAARFFFDWNSWAGLIAVLMVMSVRTVTLGSVAEVHAVYLTPNILAFSLILLAIVSAMRLYWYRCGLLLGAASLFHPLAGPECGLIIFSVGFLQNILLHGIKTSRYTAIWQGFLLFIIPAVISIFPYFWGKEEHISDSDFFNIYAYFRNPHHIIPSFFLNAEEIKNGLYLLALCLLSWIAWFRIEPKQRDVQGALFLYILAFLALALAGYIFVEVYPIRFFATAQTFRLLYILKWLCLVWAGGFIGLNLSTGTHLNRIYAWASLLSSFTLPNLVRIFILWGLSSILHRRFKLPQWAAYIDMLTALSFGVYGFHKAWETHTWLADVYIWMGFLVLLPIINLIKINRNLHFIPWTAAAIGLLFYWANHPRNEAAKTPLTQAASRQFSFQDFPKDVLELAENVKERTPSDAMLIAPPLLGELRFLAERALVVNYKTYPLKGKAMLEWQQRLFDCYTWTDMRGFDAALWAFEPNYKIINRERLLMLKEKYGATHAVLFAETICGFPVLFENEHYKLVDLRY